VEFMHYVIEARALRKVFCSIKGYYYQADIKGQIVTWIVPHQFSFQAPANVDFRLMSIFVEFYTTMLGFVNFRLYHGLNLTYPPALTNVTTTPMEDFTDKVCALNQSLVRTVTNTEDEIELDDIPVSDDSKAVEAARIEADLLQKQTKLFEGLRFFLSREVPRENLVFMIRALGGEVSWDNTVAPGATFSEEDNTITHQVADRPQATLAKSHLGRYYVQPQWVFDSLNRRDRIPEKDYALGETLPPHLSPFIAERRVGDYVPPEEKTLIEGKKEEVVFEEEESDEEEDEDEDGEGEEDEESEDEESGDKENAVDDLDLMKVEAGKAEKIDLEALGKATEDEEYKLRVMMIKKKHRGLYKSMMKGRKRRTNEAKGMEKKRKDHDDNELKEKKAKKKAKVE
jgi:pescadillo protein